MSRSRTKSTGKDEFAKTSSSNSEWKIRRAWQQQRAFSTGSTEEYNHIYWSGPEYQLLDDIKAEDNKTRFTCAGAAYGIYASPEGHLKPVGEWNKTRIIVKGSHVEHWLNGFKLLEYELGSTDWLDRVRKSKFSAWPNYGLAKQTTSGFRGDHSGSLAFRNIRIRELK